VHLTDLQDERDQWIKHNFPDDELIDSILGAVEELGELAHAHLKYKQGIRAMGTADEAEAKMADAVADCVIYLAGVCSHLGLDYGVLVRDTWEEVRKRDWQLYPVNGITE
jgi:NTP pyrophosphatase (non-canonical NTP hydrolase)